MKSAFSGFVKNVGDTFATMADAASTAVDSSITAVKESAEKAGELALDLGKSAGEAIGDAAQATSSVASKAGDVIAETPRSRSRLSRTVQTLWVNQLLPARSPLGRLSAWQPTLLVTHSVRSGYWSAI